MYFFPCQEFDDYKDADDAVYELNHKEFLGERYTFMWLDTWVHVKLAHGLGPMLQYKGTFQV